MDDNRAVSQFVSGPTIAQAGKLRGDFQKGLCKNSVPCPNGAHRCAKLKPKSA